jgi:hypothetical protein
MVTAPEYLTGYDEILYGGEKTEIKAVNLH